MKSHKVCHIATMTQWGGVERILIDFLSHVANEPLAHSLLTTSSHPALIVPIHNVGIPTYEPKRYWHYDPSSLVQMALWLRDQKIGVVHAYNAVGNAWGSIAAALAQTPIYIAGEHGSVWRIRSWMYWLNRLAYQKANVIIANSEASKTLVCKRYRINEEKIKVVYNIVASSAPVNSEFVRAKLGIGSNIVVGSIGRLTAQKGYSVLVDAAKDVLQKYPDSIFLLVGGGEEEQTLRKRIDDLGIGDRFIMTGWREDAREILQVFDLFVSTSIFEPFGNVLVEASMMGIPVIAPNVDGVPEAVGKDIAGRLLQPVKAISSFSGLPQKVIIDGNLVRPMKLDSIELAHTITEFIASEDLRKSFGQAGKHRAQSMFTTEKYVSNIQRIYMEQLDQ